MNSIEINNLTKKFPGFKLDNLNFTLPKGSILGLVGENGAGKTTAIKLILGALNADSGDVSVLGCDTRSTSFTNIKQDIGVVLDEAYFPQVLSIDKIEKILKNTYKNWDSELFYSRISEFRLPKDRPISEFSRGMKMKFALTVALSHRPKLLVLDEATSGLDPFVRENVLDILNEFTREERNSILISSHIVSDLEKICDYIAFIKEGKLILFEEKDAIIEKYALAKITKEQLADFADGAIISEVRTKFGYDLLVDKTKIPSTVRTEITTLEEIIIMLSKGEK